MRTNTFVNIETENNGTVAVPSYCPPGCFFHVNTATVGKGFCVTCPETGRCIVQCPWETTAKKFAAILSKELEPYLTDYRAATIGGKGDIVIQRTNYVNIRHLAYAKPGQFDKAYAEAMYWKEQRLRESQIVS